MKLRNNLLTIFVLSICSTTFAQAQSDTESAAASFSTIINLPEDPLNPNPIGFSGNSIGNGAEIFTDTQLNVADGGSVGDLFNVSGFNRSGNIEVNISGGTVGNDFNSIPGSSVNISGGTVGDFFAAVDNTINISGGIIGSDFLTTDSSIKISGGTIGSLETFGDSTTNISGGTINGFRVAFGSVANISDGTVGVLDVDRSTVNISGGIVGDSSEAFGGTINISGGSLGDDFNATGAFDDEVIVNISGGSVGFSFDANGGSIVNIRGGTIGDNFGAFGSTTNISGGNIGDGFLATTGSEVNIFGTEFFLNGTPLSDLILDQPAEIPERGENGVLSGLLADGTAFDFELTENTTFPNRGIGPGATLTVTLVAAVPEPGSALTLAMTSVLLLTRRRKKTLRS